MESAEWGLTSFIVAGAAVLQFVLIRVGAAPFRGWFTEVFDLVAAFVTVLSISVVGNEGGEGAWWVWLIALTGVAFGVVRLVQLRRAAGATGPAARPPHELSR